MTDLSLQLAFDRATARLRYEWDRGQPGSLDTVYEVALTYTESMLRHRPIKGPRLPEQLTLGV